MNFWKNEYSSRLIEWLWDGSSGLSSPTWLRCSIVCRVVRFSVWDYSLPVLQLLLLLLLFLEAFLTCLLWPALQPANSHVSKEAHLFKQHGCLKGVWGSVCKYVNVRMHCTNLNWCIVTRQWEKIHFIWGIHSFPKKKQCNSFNLHLDIAFVQISGVCLGVYKQQGSRKVASVFSKAGSFLQM